MKYLCFKTVSCDFLYYGVGEIKVQCKLMGKIKNNNAYSTLLITL